MSEINRNWTKGKFSSDEQKGKPGHCFAAQVWQENGVSLLHIEPTSNYDEANANAELIADALNTANKTGLTPSELLEQREELIYTLKELIGSLGDLYWKTHRAEHVVTITEDPFNKNSAKNIEP